MDGVKISVNNEEEGKKPAKKRGRPRKAATKPAAKEKAKTKSTSPKEEKKKSVAEARNDSANIKKPTSAGSKSKKGGGIATILVSILVTALVVGGVMYAWQKRDVEKDINNIKQEARSVRIDFEQRMAQLKNKLTGVENENEKLKTTAEQLEEQAELLKDAKKEYESSELGFRFLYPAVFGEVTLEFENGETGQKFIGKFSKNDKLFFSGVGSDYLPVATSSEVSFANTQGYYERRGDYFFQDIGADQSTELEFEPLETIESDGNNVLLVDKNSFTFESEVEGEENVVTVNIGEDVGALFNLDGDDYKGVAFTNQDFGMLPLESFKNMLKSIEIIN